MSFELEKIKYQLVSELFLNRLMVIIRLVELNLKQNALRGKIEK